MATTGALDEGGFNGTGEPMNNFHRLERIGRLVPRGIGADLWQRPDRMIEAVVDLGADHLSMTVEWTRVEPERGDRDLDALTRYLSICRDARLAGVAIEVRLWHFATPAWLGEEFWLFPGSPERFCEHALAVLDVIAPGVDRVVVASDPLGFAISGWITGQLPPGRHGAVRDALCVLDNLLTASRLLGIEIARRWPRIEIAVPTGAVPAAARGTLLARSSGARSHGPLDAALGWWSPNRSAGSGDALLVDEVVAMASDNGPAAMVRVETAGRAVLDTIPLRTDAAAHLHRRRTLAAQPPARYTLGPLVSGRTFRGHLTQGIYSTELNKAHPGIEWHPSQTNSGDAIGAFRTLTSALNGSI